MRPDIHDHTLLEYRVNLLDRRVTLMTRPPAPDSNSEGRPVATVFEGLEAHHFERVSSGAILLDIFEPPLVGFLQEHEHEFAEGHRLDGAPAWWRGSIAAAEDYLRGGVHACSRSPRPMGCPVGSWLPACINLCGLRETRGGCESDNQRGVTPNPTTRGRNAVRRDRRVADAQPKGR